VRWRATAPADIGGSGGEESILPWPPVDLPVSTAWARFLLTWGRTGLHSPSIPSRCRAQEVEIREEVLVGETGHVNIQPEYLGRMSNTSKRSNLRYSGPECPNTQCQAPIQTSKRGVRKMLSRGLLDGYFFCKNLIYIL
jgi:hypothetical protein